MRPCTANPVEQSHRRSKHRYYPTLGFGEFEAAQRFCRAVDEVGDFLRPQTRISEFVCLSDRRQRFVKGVEGGGAGSLIPGCLIRIRGKDDHLGADSTQFGYPDLFL